MTSALAGEAAKPLAMIELARSIDRSSRISRLSQLKLPPKILALFEYKARSVPDVNFNRLESSPSAIFTMPHDSRRILFEILTR